jgi:hypothetical protein
MKTKPRIHVWCERPYGDPNGPVIWFTASFKSARAAYRNGCEFVAIHFRRPEISHHSGRGEPNAELLAAALEYQRNYRECLNT